MVNYVRPFTITNKMLDYVSNIMEKIGKLDNYTNFNKMPVLRKNNRIKSIHSSLAIEANSLSLGQVKDVIAGRTVIGPQKEIQEVKNAYNAYEMINSVDAYSIKDLKKVHEVITYLTADESEEFRKGNEWVFDEKGNCIHVCPPPEQVPGLMKQLFDWMKKNNEEIHPLILSSIFYYKLVFIHPFSDGNGRTARLWQNIMLSKWKKIFEYLPIESQIHKFQDDYYKSINNCNHNGESTEFIEFMLKVINEAIAGMILTSNQETAQETTQKTTQEKIINLIKKNPAITQVELAKILNLTRDGISYNIKILKEKGIIERVGSTKNGIWKLL